MYHLCGAQTMMIVFMRNVSSITPKMEMSYQFHVAIKKQIK